MKIFVFDVGMVRGRSKWTEQIEAVKLHTALSRLGEKLERNNLGSSIDYTGKKDLTIKLRMVIGVKRNDKTKTKQPIQPVHDK